MLRGVPLPRWFDAAGLTPDPVSIGGEVDRVTVRGAIDVYLELE